MPLETFVRGHGGGGRGHLFGSLLQGLFFDASLRSDSAEALGRGVGAAHRVRSVELGSARQQRGREARGGALRGRELRELRGDAVERLRERVEMVRVGRDGGRRRGGGGGRGGGHDGRGEVGEVLAGGLLVGGLLVGGLLVLVGRLGRRGGLQLVLRGGRKVREGNGVGAGLQG